MSVASEISVSPQKAGAILDASAIGTLSKIDIAVLKQALAEHGAVLIKGCPVTKQDFVDLTERFGISFMEYVGGANNDRASAFGKSATVLTVTGGAVAKQAIPLHGEMFYTQPRPGTLFFCCVTPAAANGETTICDGVKLWEALPDAIREVFTERKLRYRRVYNDDAWKKVYKTDSLDEVKALCEKTGVALTEHADGTIETVHVSPAYFDHPAGRSFVNSLLVWAAREYIAKIDDSKVRFEDGSELPPEMLYKVHEIAESLTLNIPWEPGMVAMVDNFRVMHGRRAYEDDNRDIIMRLGLDRLVGPEPLAAE